MADTKKILGFAAMGIGGYILYKKMTEPEWDIASLLDIGSWFGPREVIAPVVNSAGQPIEVVEALPAVMEPPLVPLLQAEPLNVTLMQQTIKLAQQSMPLGWDGLLNSDEWNYYYTIASGVQQTSELFTPGYRSERISAETFAARRLSKGLTGLSAIRFRDVVGIARGGGASRYEMATKKYIN